MHEGTLLHEGTSLHKDTFVRLNFARDEIKKELFCFFINLNFLLILFLLSLLTLTLSW